MTDNRTMKMIYRNYRGEVSERTVSPKRIWYGVTDWHPEPGWLMEAFDREKGEYRDFALADCDFRMVAAQPAQGEAVADAVRLAIDLLKERVHGSPARSAGHNARLVLEDALRAHPTTPPDSAWELDAPPDYELDRLISDVWEQSPSLARRVQTAITALRAKGVR